MIFVWLVGAIALLSADRVAGTWSGNIASALATASPLRLDSGTSSSIEPRPLPSRRDAGTD
jgi:hypothetical protein